MHSPSFAFSLTARSRVATAAIVASVCSLCLADLSRSVAADYRIESMSESAPKDELSEAVFQTLQTDGVRVIKGSSRTLCKIWLCKEIAAGGKSDEGYALEQGSLVGVIEYARKGGDFRDQEIPPGVYTMRYAAIPTDGAHEGVSPTPAFLLLTRAEEDRDVKPIDVEALVEQSAESIDSSHPAILALKATKEGEVPQMWHDEENDWWLVQLEAKAGGNSKPKRLALVVVGYTEE